MDDEWTRSAKLAQVDLRILVQLYEVEPNFIQLSAAEIIEAPIEGVTVDDVKARLKHLGELDEVHGLATDYGLAMARLSPLMRQRLEDPASPAKGHEGETWLKRIRWIFERGSDLREVLVTRNQVLDRPFGIRRAVGPA